MAIPHILRPPSAVPRRTPLSLERYVPSAPVDSTPRTRLVGGSPALRRVLALAERVAATRAELLVTGERGTGKERLARLVHELSARAGGRLVVVRCAALDAAPLAAELFGDAGAGAQEPAGAEPAPGSPAAFRPGRLHEADGGTLILHEVGALPPALQRRLLHALQTRQLPRAGGGAPLAVDVRVIGTSNADLAAETAAGRFEPALYYRLAVCPIVMPPLRERPEDVAPLTEHFLAETAAQHGLRPAAFSVEALRQMAAHPWPGNVRELRTHVARTAILHAGETELPFERPAAGDSSIERDLLARATQGEWDLGRLEREYILAVLAATHGHQSRAAQRLGIDRRTLYRKLREYGVKG